ncbi:AAA family ATPase [Peptoanaerobacter stomatis]
MDFKEKALQYIKSNNMSNRKFADKIDVAESTFSRYMKGDYPNPTAIEDKIGEFLEKEEKRNSSFIKDSVGFAMTTISKKIINVLEYSYIQKVISCIYGDAGIGKTYTTKNWIANRNDIYFVTVTPTFATPRPFLKLLASKLKTSKTGSQDEVYLEIIEKLEGTDKMIIIDEAQHLTKKTLEIIRSINDSTSTAITLIGNELIYNKMLGKTQAEFAQLFSRVGMQSHLLTDLFNIDDIKLVFQNASDEVIEYLLKVSRSKFGLRGATLLYTNAVNNNDISIKGIKAMAEIMGIDLHIA